MPTRILGSTTLGYRPLWNAQRQLAAVQLCIASQAPTAIDAAQLVGALFSVASPSTPPLLLSALSPPLLRDLLDHAPHRTASPYWIEVRSEWMDSPGIPQRVQRAHQRGLQLVWRAESDQPPSPALAACFFTQLLRLSPQAALAALQAAARTRAGLPAGASPVHPGYLYEGVASRLLAAHCLDQQHAAALLGWPDEDVLHALQHQATAPDHPAMLQLVQAIDDDLPVEKIEALLGQEPILTFRFLAYANSAAVGLRTEVESLRHGLMLLGTAQLKHWLLAQLPQASRDPNLRPIKAAMVLRARLMENLMDAGAEHQLAREIYLCGLFSQIDLLMGEPLGSALHRVPLSSRIYNATVRNTGPYAPLLQIASALEADNGTAIRTLCHEHGMGLEDVNRALLKSLG
jgi:EAL and modified HD-GYP domain-containing signal transduction protein